MTKEKSDGPAPSDPVPTVPRQTQPEPVPLLETPESEGGSAMKVKVKPHIVKYKDVWWVYPHKEAAKNHRSAIATSKNLRYAQRQAFAYLALLNLT